MKPTHHIPAALSLAVLFSCALLPAAAVVRQDDTFDKLKTYDFQARQPVEAIRLMIDRAAGDKAATAQIEQKLDDVLADANASVAGKQEAARFLWIIGTSKSVPVLSKLLTDEKLSDTARYALERDAGPEAGKALTAALPASQGNSLVGIINSIGNRGDAEAVPALKRYIMDSNPLVAEAAIMAVGKIGTPASVAILKSLPADNVTAGVALRRSAEKLAGSGKAGPAAQVYALMWNASRPANIRGEALRGLANLKAPNAGSVALAALKSNDPYLQVVAAQVIGSMDDPATTSAALTAWPRLPAPIQVALLTVLAEKRDKTAASAALAAIDSKDAAVRHAGIRAAGRVGGAPAVPRLIEVMLQGEGGDRGAAREALAAMPGAEAEKAILEQARSAMPEARTALMGVLVDRPSPPAVAVLLETAQGNEARPAVAAIRGLGRTGGMKEQTELIKLLVATNDDDVRDASKSAVVSIGQRLGDRERAAAAIHDAYTAASGPAKVTLIGALAETGGDRAYDELTRAATSSDGAIRQAAIQALADTWQDSRPLGTLLGIAKSNSDRALRVQALRGYVRLVNQDEGMPAAGRVARVGDALKAAERPEEKRQALSVLRDVRTPASVELAAQYLSDPELFSDAAGTIVYLAGPRRKNNRNLEAVKGEATTAALDKIIAMTKDDSQRAEAEKLK